MRWRIAVGGMPLVVALAASFVASVFAEAQTEKPADYSNEAFVIESRSIQTTYENDGTAADTVRLRVRIQTQAGIQGFGVLTFPYASATSTMEVVHVRVIKPDGRIIVTPSENVLEMPAEITRQAPFYSDLKELQVAVKGLEVGDILETEVHGEVKTPLAPRQFWDAFDFFDSGIVLRETLEVRVPRDRKVKVKSSKVQPTVTDEGAYRVYRWTTQNLARSSPEAADATEQRASDVELSSFQNWDELGAWVHSLFGPRASPSPEIQAKAAELTRGATTDTEKIHRIYDFVATKFRYIGVSFGVGRYQPHAAADILSNDYGDCKDKDTLLTSLLAAAGTTAYPALINPQAKIDPDIPSPAQFDHVITAIPQAKGFLFLDTTSEVAPFGFLTTDLRDKQALVVKDDGTTELVKIPADPPIPSFFDFQADGTLDDTGTFTGKMHMIFRGDPELSYRQALRAAGQAQWKDVMQKISQNLGFGGTVSDVTATPPEATDKPFEIGYSYKREKYSDWENRQIAPPFPPIFLPEASDDKDASMKPIELGSPGVSDYLAAIHLPPNSSPQLPAAVHLSEDFAEYTATYSFSDGVFHAERRLTTKVHEVRADQLPAYRKFVKLIVADVTSLIPVSGGSGGKQDVSGNAEARDLFEQGREAWEVHNLPSAMDAFRRSVDKDPKFAQGWLALGTLQAATGQIDKAIEEFRIAVALEPDQTLPYQALTSALLQQHRPEDALKSWLDLEKAAPQNPDAPEHAGAILNSLKRYSEAVPQFEAAIRLEPDKSELLVELGTAYARAGDKEKALASLKRSAQTDTSSNNLNGVAYALADENLDLNAALKYAELAVGDEEKQTATIDLEHLDASNLKTPSTMAAYWDTLGWVHFRMGEFERAERYIDAAWRVAQNGIVGDHLGQVYEKLGKRERAIAAYSGALAAHGAPEETTARLNALRTGPSAPAGPLPLQEMRMARTKVTPKPSRHASAEFFLLLVPGPKVAAVRFLNSQEEFAGAADGIKTAKFDVSFPDDGPEQILRRGFLDCEPEIAGCTIALIPVADVRSVN